MSLKGGELINGRIICKMFTGNKIADSENTDRQTEAVSNEDVLHACVHSSIHKVFLGYLLVQGCAKCWEDSW